MPTTSQSQNLSRWWTGSGCPNCDMGYNWHTNDLFNKIHELIVIPEQLKAFISGGILSEYLSLLALHLSGTPSLRTGSRPPSCFHLNNHLYICKYCHLKSKNFETSFRSIHLCSWWLCVLGLHSGLSNLMLPGDVALESQLFCQSSKSDLEEKENPRLTWKILGSNFAKFSRVKVWAPNAES